MCPQLTKKCKGPCGQNKPLDDFHWKNKIRGTRQSRCKTCMAEYGREHYVENRDDYLERSNARLKALRAGNAQMVKDWISSHSCISCQEADPRCLRTSVVYDDIANKGPDTLAQLLASGTVTCLNCLAKQE